MNIVATTLTAMITFAAVYFYLLLCWMEMHQYAYLIWTVAFGSPVTQTDPQN